MSDNLKHECGLAYIRLRKPFSFYQEKYGDAFYGLKKLYLLMEKQRNRGQDGAGLGVLKLDVPRGDKFLRRIRVSGGNAVNKIFKRIEKDTLRIELENKQSIGKLTNLKECSDFAGEVLMGHLRYATQGLNNIEFCHPFVITNHNPSRNLAMAGNFNLINTDELFQFLGLSTNGVLSQSDLGAMIETFYHFLDQELTKNPNQLDVNSMLKQASDLFDGGYVCCGIIGNGDSFVLRDKYGIRPAFFMTNDEFVVAASERPAIMTSFNAPLEEIREIPAGHALIVKKNGDFSVEKINEDDVTQSPCSFERIYFSRGNDKDIYEERINLGKNLVQKVLLSLNNDLDNVVFSFIPNTAELAFYGMIQGLERKLNDETTDYILRNKPDLSFDDVELLLNRKIRIEKVIQKDVKMRTFITNDNGRNELVNHVYDVTYDVVRPTDTLVVIDDSIVRGTTLKQSIIRILDRLNPKKIIIVSSAPQIRYPDCYGIDMSKLGDFIAFQAVIELINEYNMTDEFSEIYQLCKTAEKENRLKEENYVKRIYDFFSEEEITKKISQMLRPEGIQAEVEVIYQTVSGLHKACSMHKGDWYFTGNYPTPGGNRVSNRAFLNFIEKKNLRGY